MEVGISILPRVWSRSEIQSSPTGKHLAKETSFPCVGVAVKGLSHRGDGNDERQVQDLGFHHLDEDKVCGAADPQSKKATGEASKARMAAALWKEQHDRPGEPALGPDCQACIFQAG